MNFTYLPGRPRAADSISGLCVVCSRAHAEGDLLAAKMAIFACKLCGIKEKDDSNIHVSFKADALQRPTHMLLSHFAFY
jgi:hypothetical protein